MGLAEGAGGFPVTNFKDWFNLLYLTTRRSSSERCSKVWSQEAWNGGFQTEGKQKPPS